MRQERNSTVGEGAGIILYNPFSLSPPFLLTLLGCDRHSGHCTSVLTPKGVAPSGFAPTQLVGRSDGVAGMTITARADVYSLGCSLYFLLPGQPPFPGEGRMEVLMKHQTEDPPPLRRSRPDVPAA